MFWLVAIFVAFGLAVNSFQNNLITWVSIWVSMPLIASFVWLSKIKDRLLLNEAGRWRKLSFGLTLALSVLILTNFTRFENLFGHHFIDGYEFHIDKERSPYDIEAIRITTSHKSGKIALWSFQWAMIALCMLVPYLTHRYWDKIEQYCRLNGQKET